MKYPEGFYTLTREDAPPVRLWLSEKEARALLGTPRSKHGHVQSSLAWRRSKHGHVQSSLAWRLDFVGWVWEGADQ